MRKNVIDAIVRKDLIQLKRKKILSVTLVLIPILFGVLIPNLAVFFISKINESTFNDPELLKLINKFLSTTSNNALREASLSDQLLYVFVNYPMISMFLLVPVITCSVIAASSLVGEKEQKTLESILFSPVSISELFISKIIVSTVLPYLISLLCLIINIITFNFFILEKESIVSFPSNNWWIITILLLPMLLLFTSLINLMISTRVSTYQEANNLSGLLVLPIIGMLIGQISGLFFISQSMLLIISFVLTIINLLIFKLSKKYNSRDQLFSSQM